MANIQVFEYQNSKVRTVDMDGEAWFVLKDVCAVLGISNNRILGFPSVSACAGLPAGMCPLLSSKRSVSAGNEIL